MTGPGSLTGGSDSTATDWNADTGEIEAVALGHKASVTAVEWSKDGTRLATGSNDEQHLPPGRSTTTPRPR